MRDATGKIKAAISISSAARYMNDGRRQTRAKDARRTAEQISHELGWGGPPAKNNRRSDDLTLAGFGGWFFDSFADGSFRLRLGFHRAF